MRFSEIQAQLERFTVGIAGAGGLGSNCAIALARSGIGTLVLSDFDVVEEANLNRQYFFADQSGVIRFSNEGPATVDSPALGGGIAGLKGNQSSRIQGTPVTGETGLGRG